MAPDNGWRIAGSIAWPMSSHETFVVEAIDGQLSTAMGQWQATFRSAGRAVARLVDALRFSNLVERDRYHLARAHALSFVAPPPPPVFDLAMPLRLPVVRSYALRVNSAGRPGRRARRSGGVRV